MNLLTELNKSRTLKWGDPDSTEDDDAVVYLCALAADEITRLTADLKTAMNERDAYLDGLTDLRAELARWKAAIEGLTPQGSEYVDDPERCAEAIRERCRYPKQVIGLRAENAALWELLSNMRIEIDSAEAENAALRELLEGAYPYVQHFGLPLLRDQIRAALDDAKQHEPLIKEGE